VRLLGDDFQVACAKGKPDVCAAVRLDFGRFKGCEGRFCLEGLDGFELSGCSRGARVSSAEVELTEAFGGGTLVLVSVYGRSGFSIEDRACRVRQFEQVFVDRGDGRPAAFGARNVILGDFNTDPGRLAPGDESALRLLDFVGETGDPDRRFRFAAPIGPDTPTTYGVASIDHVVTDFADTILCTIPGVTPGAARVLETVYWDHAPLVCELAAR
jgi:hypothetical protein